VCGIVGFVGPRDDALAERMRDRLRHRGPDGGGLFADDRVTLGHRRLAIVDVTGGHQPAFSEDGAIVVTFNGEIYNHPALRPALERRGHRFGSNSDTESLVHLWEELGPELPTRLDGMFAFVLYDRRRRVLFGARDRFGKKPLLHWQAARTDARAEGLRFAFASELKALREHPAIRAATGDGIDPRGLLSYLLHDYVTGQARIHPGFGEIPPGHAFLFGLDDSTAPGLRVWPYFRLGFGPDHPGPSAADSPPAEVIAWMGRTEPFAAQTVDARGGLPVIGERAARAADRWLVPKAEPPLELREELLELLMSAVDKRLMADVPLGVFLSGGIDSSLVTALLTRLHPPESIDTFSIGFDDPTFDESRWSNEVAVLLGTRHHHRLFAAADLTRLVEPLAADLDEPFADPSILPVALLSEFTRERVTVALGGDGGDELFAGYDPFRAVASAEWYRRLMPATLHGGLVRPLAARLPSTSGNMALDFQVNRFLRGAGRPPHLRSAAWMGPFEPAQLRRLAPDLMPRDRTDEALLEDFLGGAAGADVPSGSAIDRSLDWFSRVYLPDDILVKVDRASMRHSLEVRCPLLDADLAAFVNRLPAGWKLSGGVTKRLLKRTLELGGKPGGRCFGPILPERIVQRKKKGFGIPVARWIRGELADDFRRTLLDTWPAELDFILAAERRRLLERHQSGRENLYKELWALFMLGVWWRTAR
jgi:asparagine synthase (glutamine-hydrolysing)